MPPRQSAIRLQALSSGAAHHDVETVARHVLRKQNVDLDVDLCDVLDALSLIRRQGSECLLDVRLGDDTVAICCPLERRVRTGMHRRDIVLELARPLHPLSLLAVVVRRFAQPSAIYQRSGIGSVELSFESSCQGRQSLDMDRLRGQSSVLVAEVQQLCLRCLLPLQQLLDLLAQHLHLDADHAVLRAP